MNRPTPRVRHYRAAQGYAAIMGGSVARDYHVIAQLLGVKTMALESSPQRYISYAQDALALATIPVRRRAERDGDSFRIVACACCDDCAILCDCQQGGCGCADPPAVGWVRQPMGYNVRQAWAIGQDGNGYLDSIGLVQACTTLPDGQDFDELPYAEYLAFDQAVARAVHSPLALWQVTPPTWYTML